MKNPHQALDKPTRGRCAQLLHAARLAAGAVAAMAGFASSAQELPADGVYKDHIDWGVVMDMSGPTSEAQSTWVKGFQDFMRGVNEAGGINGRRINVLAEDNRFSAANDKVIYEKFVSQTPVLGFSGMGSSGGQVSLAPTIRAGKVPVLGTYTPTKALLEPASPLTYHGMCSYRAMAQTGVGYFADTLKLKAPKVITVAIESAGGKEYHEYVAEAVAKVGGSASMVTMKVNAVDVTPQALEIIAQKPDFIAIYGVNNTSILTMKALAQYGVKIPAFAIVYLAQPQIYAAMGPQAGAGYHVSTCISPGGSDNTPGNKALVAMADKAGRGTLKEDINYAAGWVAGQLVSDRIGALGANPSRARLVETMAQGFTVDTKGLSAPIVYTKDDHQGLRVHKVISFDYATGKVRHHGEFRDYEKYLK
jgi:branched-chain amino acid transport system substrate-binding protein